MRQFLSAYFLHPQQTKGKIQKVMLQCFCVVYHISLAKQNCSYKVHTHETGKRFDQQRKRSNNPFPFFPLFSKSGEEVRFLQGETNPAGRPNQDDLLLCSNLCLHADRLQRERLPLAKHWPVPKNFQPVGFVSPSDRKLSPPPSCLPPPLLQLRWACRGSTEHTDVDVPQRKLYPHPLMIVILQPNNSSTMFKLTLRKTKQTKQTDKQTNKKLQSHTGLFRELKYKIITARTQDNASALWAQPKIFFLHQWWNWSVMITLDFLTLWASLCLSWQPSTRLIAGQHHSAGKPLGGFQWTRLDPHHRLTAERACSRYLPL